MKDASAPINYRLEIDLPFNIIAQMSERRPHPISGSTYHIQFTPPKIVDN
jgi:hypothetical protein